MIVLRKYIKEYEIANGKKKKKNKEVKQRMRRGYKRLKNIQTMVRILGKEQLMKTEAKEEP
jgi:vacuolar-type H+-ATPase subunit B/Vma2